MDLNQCPECGADTSPPDETCPWCGNALYPDDVPPVLQDPDELPRRPHSGLGVASVTLAGVGLGGIVLAFLTGIGAWEAALVASGVDMGAFPPTCLGPMGLAIPGLVFGAVGLADSRRSRVLPLLGVALNGLILLSCGGLAFYWLLG